MYDTDGHGQTRTDTDGHGQTRTDTDDLTFASCHLSIQTP
jgi:hypothetical protein